MIINKEPLSMAEALQYVKQEGTEETDVIGFTKKFVKIKNNKAIELRKKLQSLDMLKMKEEHIIKIIDLLPEDISELNKIFVDVSLDNEEAQKILDTVKEAK